MKWRMLLAAVAVAMLVLAMTAPVNAGIGAKPNTTTYTAVVNGSPVSMVLPGAPNRDVFIRFISSISEEAGQEVDEVPVEDYCGVGDYNKQGDLIGCWVELPCVDCMHIMIEIVVHG